ncbi:hypothetical protein [Pedobacter glucosidilyticus]|jgi:hypothetical protein|uniref:hypothetical protein n=1 Tax=Pedobacter glucosidilyticus TaxID=1122941 RepID=UPI0026EFB950|nr:hypothetical protein [Pedobacter glucosidilyticus]
MKRVGIIIVLFVLISLSSETFAQCAMCQATVESNLDNGGTAGKGLNSGIMYLLAAPYLAMLGIGYLWYKKYRKKDVTIDIKSERINLN